MENQSSDEKLLPKPLTDLPLPRPPATEAAGNVGQAEKEILARAIPQGQALQNQKPNIFKSKFFLGFVAFSVLIGFLIGGFMLGRNSVFKELNPATPSIPPKDPDVYKGTPAPDPTADWKTYTNSELGFTIEYPEGWTMNDQSYISGGQEYIGFAIQGPLRTDIPEANGKNAYYTRALKWDPQTKTLVTNKAFGESGELFLLERKGNEQAPTEVSVANEYINNSMEHTTAEQILSTFKFTN